MAYAPEDRTGFTVTFRSLVLQAAKGPARKPAPMPRLRAAASVRGLPHGPLRARVTEAFTARPPNETEWKVIAALLRHPGATSPVLSRQCGWLQPIWQTHFGLMCQRRAAWLWPAEAAGTPDARFLTGVLADYRPNLRTFSFKPEVAAALKALPVDWRT